ncbi:hypothetical protein [Burkholderia cepacia]|uniref:hypothetical protein n=1 Tax=Burkholderia cepacia TaxID=292 RepID=UPI0038CD984B
MESAVAVETNGFEVTTVYFVVESVDALPQKSETPLTHRGARMLQALRARVTEATEIEQERAIDMVGARSSSLSANSTSTKDCDRLLEPHNDRHR